jgi:ribosomal protein L10
VYVGDDQIEVLTKLKSKEELVGEIIGLLQSPAKNVISALNQVDRQLQLYLRPSRKEVIKRFTKIISISSMQIRLPSFTQ